MFFIETRVGSGQCGKRRRRVVKKSTSISNNSLKKLARRAGVYRIKKEAYDEVRSALNCFLNSILKVATLYCLNEGRTTVSLRDILNALKYNPEKEYRCPFLC